MKSLLVLITLLFCVTTSCSQDITAKEGSFGIDESRNLIVWYLPDLDTKAVKSINFGSIYKVKGGSKKLNYNEAITVKGKTDYKLYITKLPIVHVSMDENKMNSRKKIAGKFSYYDDTQFFKSTMGIRHRGNLSLSFAKKSFDIELWKNDTLKESIDASFKNMRNDDDWILDAMYNEPLRLRSFIAANFWNKIHEPYYLSEEPEAKSGFDVAFVEVFKNDRYYGIYQLMESVDRKQLQVKKKEGTSIKGRLYRAESYEGGPDFTKAPAEYNNLFPHWIGWETNYPFIDYKSDFEDVFQFQQLVVNASDEEFKSEISKAFVLSNAIDYYIFVNLIRATDNLGKNYTLAKYDVNAPYFIVPWDLDGTFGVIQDGKQIPTTNDVLTNGLFKRLIAQNPEAYNSKLKKRWNTLRKTVLSDTALFSEIKSVYETFTKENIYEREFLVWKNKLNEKSNETHYAYLTEWLKDRLDYLDAYFESL